MLRAVNVRCGTGKKFTSVVTVLSGRLRCQATVWHKAVGNIAQPLAPLLLSVVGVVIGAEVIVLVHALVVFNKTTCSTAYVTNSC
jgi:uncharacterized protein YhhL (DUF1145 family)